MGGKGKTGAQAKYKQYLIVGILSPLPAAAMSDLFYSHSALPWLIPAHAFREPAPSGNLPLIEKMFHLQFISPGDRTVGQFTPILPHLYSTPAAMSAKQQGRIQRRTDILQRANKSGGTQTWSRSLPQTQQPSLGSGNFCKD
jgi:hypothetical protein